MISNQPICAPTRCSYGRVFLDVIGTLPTPEEIEQFMADTRSDKRSALIDDLLSREEFADYWSLKWCDLFRVKSEFPINLWPNAVQAYHRWIHNALHDNKHYDQFVRELLTSSGSNFRVPPVNFYRAVQGHEPSAIAASVSLNFMGVRYERWSEADQQNLAKLFSRVAFKPTAEWKEEIVYCDPAATEPIEVTLPDGQTVKIAPYEDPRLVFADWLISPKNPWFTRNIVNRVWSWLMGRGIIHEPDDIHPDNPPANPELLAYMEQAFIESEYDLRQLFRLILNSRTYQQSAIPQSDHPDVEIYFACYPIRQLEAEVLIDAIDTICGSSESYMSMIPEPFTYIPESQRSIMLADGSITSPFLELFGRPSRDSGQESERNNEPTNAQRLHLLNSSHIQNKIQGSKHLRKLLREKRRNPRQVVKTLYLLILSREPTADEQKTVEEYIQSAGKKRKEAIDDFVWALINSKEFLYRH